MVAGSIIEIDTPLGSRMPVQYSENGEMFGQARDIASYLGSSTDTGQWWVEGDRLCHKWEHWFNAEPNCQRLMREGSGLRWHWPDGSKTTTSKMPSVAATEPRREPDPLPAARKVAPFDTSYRQSLGLPNGKAATEPPRAASSDIKSHASAYKVINVDSTDVLNVRNGPSSDFPAISQIPPDSTGIVVTGPCRLHWCPVRHNDVSGWVKRSFLTSEDATLAPRPAAFSRERDQGRQEQTLRDPPEAPRSCLTEAAHALLDQIEKKFGPMQLMSTCRSGATIAGSGRPSKHASGNAIDFEAGARKQAVVQWLIANHHTGGTMTYSDMDHIHVDIGPHFVSLGAPSGGGGGRYARRWNRWSNG